MLRPLARACAEQPETRAGVGLTQRHTASAEERLPAARSSHFDNLSANKSDSRKIGTSMTMLETKSSGAALVIDAALARLRVIAAPYGHPLIGTNLALLKFNAGYEHSAPLSIHAAEGEQ